MNLEKLSIQKVVLLVIILVLSTTACKHTTSSAEKEDAQGRTWQIHVPDGLTGNVPLVVDLHGYTSTSSGQRAISGFEQLADANGFIVVWPQGINNSWNSGTCCGISRSKGVDDVAFIRALVAQIVDEQNIDANRIYVTGLSNGCSMSQRLAMDASDLFAAAACMAFYLLIPENETYSPIPVMEIHGTSDYTVPYNPGAADNFSSWAGYNGCSGSPVITEISDSGSAETGTVQTYQNCSGNAKVSLVTIDGGGHVLYDGYGTNFNTSAMAWDFVSAFSK
jgi:polyhydroxybutyrate depolymerase